MAASGLFLLLVLARQGVGQTADTKALEDALDAQAAEEVVNQAAEAETAELLRLLANVHSFRS